MIYGLYLSAAGALAEDARNSVISNNLANVSTPAFKPDIAVFRERAPESVEEGLPGYATQADGIGGGLLVSGTYTRHGQGPIEVTNRPYDLAVIGEGYFPVTDGSRVLYTRAGAFSRDSRGRLTTQDGRHFLADASGRPLSVPDGDIEISHDGTVSVGGEAAARIGIVGFEDEGRLAKAGSNLFDASGAEAVAATGSIRQGALESSAVSAAEEMANMILAMRGYEANMRMISMQDQSLADLVTVGRITV